MAEMIMQNETNEAREQGEIDERFRDIVEEIDIMPTAELKEALTTEPYRKEEGKQDQGVRFN
jgi:hypothetical protein